MADEADRAQEDIEILDRAAQAVRKPEGPAATGECLHCGDLLDNGRRWCDAECRDLWQAEQ